MYNILFKLFPEIMYLMYIDLVVVSLASSAHQGNIM